jgi:hypothetical protein
MRAQRIHLISFIGLFALSLTALLDVLLLGYTQPPQADEGYPAHY